MPDCFRRCPTSAKEVERISQTVGGQAETFHAAEAEASLSDNIIPIKPVPKMYVCIDGTGVPVVKKETAGRKGKGEDGQAKTREAKLGCVFTQTCVDREGRPVRDDESTSYTGAIETAELFGRRIYQEAMRRGMDSAGETVVIGDGAPWIWNIADEQFYGATQIVDLFHAREHYWNVAKACFGQSKDKLYQWTEERCKELDDGRPEDVIDAIHRCSSLPGYDQSICEREIGYFKKNKERMRYAEERSLCRLWGLGGRVPNRRWTTPETVGHALDSQGSEQYYRPALQYSEQSVGRFLGAPCGGLKSPS